MGNISSRTPEGQPGRCPLCGADVSVLPAEPLGDAPCPACGTLLWPLPAGDAVFLLGANELTAVQRAKLREVAARFAAGEMDSMDRLEMLLELADILNVSIPDEAAERFETLDDVVSWYLRERDGPPQS